MLKSLLCLLCLFVAVFLPCAKENNHGRNKQAQIPERRRQPQLAANDPAKASALQRITMQDVDVVESKPTKTQQQ